MGETFKLKPIHEDAVDEALAKAERYRLLNDPMPAESICRDVLRLQPDNQKALTMIVLALSDQFGAEGGAEAGRRAREYAASLHGEYERLYYSALIHEREARAMLTRGMARSFAYDGLRNAMQEYERAEGVRPPGNDDAILRWNSCVRTIRQLNLEPRVEDDTPLLLE